MLYPLSYGSVAVADLLVGSPTLQTQASENHRARTRAAALRRARPRSDT